MILRSPGSGAGKARPRAARRTIRSGRDLRIFFYEGHEQQGPVFVKVKIFAWVVKLGAKSG